MNNLTEIFCNLNYHWSKSQSEHKSFEIEAYSGLIGFVNMLHVSIWNRAVSFNMAILYALLHFELRIEWKTAHAGVSLWFGLLGFDVGLHLHDTRHWDYENNRWEVYEEDDE